MKRTSFADTNCPIARSLDVIGEWWTLLILRDIFCGISRFDKLLLNLGIARNVLTDRLRTLVESGILEKRAYQEKPERYEYQLTESGRELIPVLAILIKWGNRWLPSEAESTIELFHETCGQVTTPLLTCSNCEGEITTQNVRPNNLGDQLQMLRINTKKQRNDNEVAGIADEAS